MKSSIANQVLDFEDDVEKTLFREIGKNMPDLVKTASVTSRDEKQKLDNSSFGLVVLTKVGSTVRKFPLTTKGDTWLSSEYFDKTAEQLPYVAQKIAATHIKEACKKFSITPSPSVMKLASQGIETNRYNELSEGYKLQSQIKVASVTPDNSKHFFALDNKYPMSDSGMVKKAASYFEEYVDQFGTEERQAYARNVVARAQELGVDVESDALRKYAGQGYGDSVLSNLEKRKEILWHDDAYVAALTKLAEAKDKTDPETFAKALHLFDKKAGIDKHYDRSIEDHISTTFGEFKKHAGYSWSDEKAGVEISAKAIATTACDKHEKVASYFGSTIADSFKKHPTEIFESLPTDAKIVIAKIASGEI